MIIQIDVVAYAVVKIKQLIIVFTVVKFTIHTIAPIHC